MGEVVNVKAGFARNFLIPRARRCARPRRTSSDFEKRRASSRPATWSARRRRRSGGKVDGQSVTLLRQASETGAALRLGHAATSPTRSPTPASRSTGSRSGSTQPLKTLGLHKVTVALHPEVEVTVTVNVARTQDEADVQAGRARPQAEDEDADDEQSLIGEIEALVGFG